MASKNGSSFGTDFRHFFLRGLAVLLPTVLTLWIVVAAYRFVENNIAEPINSGIRRAIIWVAPRTLSADRFPDWFVVTPEKVAQERQARGAAARPLSDEVIRTQLRARNYEEWWRDKWYTRFIGLVVAIVLIYLAGRLVGGFIGRRVYARVERAFIRVPVIKQVYPSVKQVVDFVFGDRQIKFSSVVVVQYPRLGIWTLGFATGPSFKEIAKASETENMSIFIPSSPTPFTGYTITVPKSEVIEIPITVDEALRFVVSGGVLLPPRQVPEGAEMPDGEDARGLASDAALAMMEGARTETSDEPAPASQEPEPGGAAKNERRKGDDQDG